VRTDLRKKSLCKPLWRLQNGELESVAPKVFVLQAGTNNLPWNGAADAAKVEEVVSSIKSLVRLLQNKSPNSTTVLTALFPRTQNRALASTIQQINDQLEKLSDGKSIRFLNINSKLTDSSGALLPGMSDDGLHFTEKSYQVWADALKPILLEILGPPAPDDHAPPPTGDPKAKLP
jgi:lysophospholipase L1-like esterase